MAWSHDALDGMPADLPVLAVAHATTPRETRLRAPLRDIAADVTRAGMQAPVLFIIGHVVSLADPAALSAEAAGQVAHA